jgi:MFS family permease
MTPLRGERDARLIDATAFLRSAAVGLVGVTLAIYLAEVGFSATRIGLLIGVGLIGSSLATIIVSLDGHTWGRRRVLIGIALLSALGYRTSPATSPGRWAHRLPDSSCSMSRRLGRW